MRDIITIVEGGLPPIPEALVDYFKHGACYALAVRHHQRFGWPISVIGFTDDTNGEMEFWHAVNIHPNGQALDVEGPRSVDEMERAYLDDDEIAAGWGCIPMTDTAKLKKVLARIRSQEDLDYADAAIDRFLKPRYRDLYP